LACPEKIGTHVFPWEETPFQNGVFSHSGRVFTMKNLFLFFLYFTNKCAGGLSIISNHQKLILLPESRNIEKNLVAPPGLNWFVGEMAIGLSSYSINLKVIDQMARL
jgi:hypothetical protein